MISRAPRLQPFAAIEGEEWRSVPGWNGRYEVSNLGRVRSLFTHLMTVRRTPVVLTPRYRRGYPNVTLSHGRKSKYRDVHILVIEAFKGPRPLGMQCAHLDGNRRNPHADNLIWATAKENTSHKKLHGTQAQGSQMAAAILTEQQVVQMRSLKGSLSHAQLAKQFGTCRSNVTRILAGKGWRHV